MNEVRREQGPDAAADEPLTRTEPAESASPAEADDAQAETENWIREQLAGRAAVSTVTAPTEEPSTEPAADAEPEADAAGTDAVGDADPASAPEPSGDAEPASDLESTVDPEADDAGTSIDPEESADSEESADPEEETAAEALPAYRRFDVTGSDPAALAEAAEAARTAIENGECVVLPTDTVYGIGADAFEPDAVQRLQDAKERGRDKPPPVLIGDPALIRALAEDVPAPAVTLTEKHWPGPLTVIVKARDSLRVDLGDTNGTIGLRVPDYELTRELLRQTGPMAVSSANLSGRPSALTCDEAIEYFGNRVSVYLDGGPLPNPDGAPSSMVDFSQNENGELLRLGALSLEVLRETCPDLVDLTAPDQTDPEPTDPEPTDPEPTDPERTDVAATDVPETSEDVERLIEDRAADSDPAEKSEAAEPEPEPLELKDPEPTDPEPTDPEPTDPEPTDPEPKDPAPTDPDRQP